MLSVLMCNNCFCILTKFKLHRFYLSKVLYSAGSYTDAYIENLVLEEGIMQEYDLTKYIQNLATQSLFKEILWNIFKGNKNEICFNQQIDSQELAWSIEKEIDTKIVPNEKLKFLLVYFTKGGNVNGVKAVQSIFEKHNLQNFKYQAEYNHYLAEAFWIRGNLNSSLNLFSLAYDNVVTRPKVKVMLPNLFPLLTAEHSNALLGKIIYDIELFSEQKQDLLILAWLWRELFLSTWFSDHEQASKILMKNNQLLKYIEWMIPSMGRSLLRFHRVDEFYKLIQFTLENSFKPKTESLIRLLFEYYYIQQNIERCTAVVKFSSTLNSCLTEEQKRRYVGLLLKSKNDVNSRLILKKPQDLRFKF